MYNFNNEAYLDFLSEWKDERKYDPFFLDGLIDIKKWENSSKIMFLLKESYGSFYEIHEGGSFGPSAPSPYFWRHMRMYTYIADEMLKGNIPEWEKASVIKEEPNDSVAYVNIKKLVEDNKKSDDDEIEEFAKKDKEYLLRQINLLSPKIIFCTGTYRFREIIFGKENITPVSKHLSLYNKVLLVDYYHLSFVIGSQEAFNEVVGILGEYLKTPG
jgi:hypothetical protein